MSACVTQYIYSVLVCVLFCFCVFCFVLFCFVLFLCVLSCFVLFCFVFLFCFCSCFVCKTDTMHRFQKLTAIVFNVAITVLSHSRHVTQLQIRPRARRLRLARAPDVLFVLRLRQGQLHSYAGKCRHGTAASHVSTSRVPHAMQAGGVEKAVSFSGGAQMSTGER